MSVFASEPYGQLQLELDGIPMLSQAEQLEQWLQRDSIEPDSLVGIEAVLTVRDAETRPWRARRWLRLHALEARYWSSWGWLIPGGAEGIWLYADAVSAYVNGEYLATVVCSHAAAERTLAARLASREQLGGLERAGLGPLVIRAHEMSLIDDEAKGRLLDLNDIRRPIAHLKSPLAQHSIARRLTQESSTGDYDEDMNNLLRGDAERALECADFALRGMGPGL